MKKHTSNLEPAPLWQQVEQSNQAEHETTDAPLLKEFTQLSELMDSAPKVIENHDMNGEQVELTPSARFTSNRVYYFNGQPTTVSKEGDNYSAVLEDRRIDACKVDTQAHRVKGAQQLYLALAIHTVKPEYLQYTIHDGYITDLADSEKEVSDDEILTVKAALEAITSEIHDELEEIDSQRLKRKMGRFFANFKPDYDSPD